MSTNIVARVIRPPIVRVGVTRVVGPPGLPGEGGVPVTAEPNKIYGTDDAGEQTTLVVSNEAEGDPTDILTREAATAAGRAAFVAFGPDEPSSPVGSEVVWFKTDGNGSVIDILSGVIS